MTDAAMPVLLGREKRAGLPLALLLFIGIAAAVMVILMVLANRPEPPRRSSIARPVPRPVPRVPSTGCSRPPAPRPGVVPVALDDRREVFRG